MRRYFATHLFFILAVMVTLSIIFACGVSGLGYSVLVGCMLVIFFSGRYAEYVDNRFERLEREDVDA